MRRESSSGSFIFQVREQTLRVSAVLVLRPWMWQWLMTGPA